MVERACNSVCKKDIEKFENYFCCRLFCACATHFCISPLIVVIFIFCLPLYFVFNRWLHAAIVIHPSIHSLLLTVKTFDRHCLSICLEFSMRFHTYNGVVNWSYDIVMQLNFELNQMRYYIIAFKIKFISLLSLKPHWRFWFKSKRTLVLF